LAAERAAEEAARKAEEERIAAEKAAHEAAEARRILEENFEILTALADNKKATVVDALKKRREGLLASKKQCDYMIAGQANVAQAAVDAKVGVEAAAAQQAGRAQVAVEIKGTFEDMAAKLGELQSSVDAIFLEEKKLYAEEATAGGSGEATELADGGHALWMGWKKAFDEQFSQMKSFVQLRHGQLVSYNENYEYLRADRMPVSEKTDAPDGLNCYTPTEFQAKLDEIDSKISAAEQNAEDYGYPEPLPPIEEGLGIRQELAGPEDTAIHDEIIKEHPELEVGDELVEQLPRLERKLHVPLHR
jgi:preprotein translocase subunit SecD